MLSVVEMFESIQGESTFSGLPFFFIRLAGCNLRCRYCDTSYAWAEGEKISVGDICDAAVASGRRYVLVTGGEPLLQPEAPTLLSALRAHGLTVLLETNGSLDISVTPADVIRVLDIKTPASGESSRMLWTNLDALQSHDQVKFVVAHDTDLPWIEEIIRRHDLDRRVTVLISPVTDCIDPRDIAAWILRSALIVRLQLQLHKIIWGPDRRGV